MLKFLMKLLPVSFTNYRQQAQVGGNDMGCSDVVVRTGAVPAHLPVIH